MDTYQTLDLGLTIEILKWLKIITGLLVLVIVLRVLSFCIKPYWKTQEELERRKQIVRDQRKAEREESQKNRA